MALDRQRALQQAERLLKQGKVPAAMVELERLSDSAPKDVLTLNRIGDLLAKQGRREEAVRFYLKIAEQLTQSGFLHKAVAIHKKILRLSPNHVGALVQLGDLYYQQRLPGEARTHLLRAADQFLQASNFAKAREVYERLVAAEPDDPRHRARLAEARAAEGQAPQAGEELLELADTLFAAGKAHEAEQAYRRAVELLPERDEPVVGLVRCVSEQGRGEEAVALLDQAERKHAGSVALLGERILRYESAGRGRDAIELLKLPNARLVEDEVFAHVFRFHRDRGSIEGLWQRLDPVFERWQSEGHGDRVRSLFECLVEIEVPGHVPALRRLYADHRARGDRVAARQTLESLIRACRSGPHADEAEEWEQELQRLDPSSAARTPAAEAEAQGEEEYGTEEAIEAEAGAAPLSEGARGAAADDLPIEFEAPAVPLNRADEEYVAGRLTQTEILEKYGLREQAVQQIREVTDKFPGHVPAQEKLVELQREGGSPHGLRDSLVGLALARRALGDSVGARKACAEARAIAPLPRETAALLGRLGIVESFRSAPRPPEPPAEPPRPASRRESPPPEPSPHDASPHEVAHAPGHDGAVLIDLDAMEDEDEAAPAEAEAVAPEPEPFVRAEVPSDVGREAAVSDPEPIPEAPEPEMLLDVEPPDDDDLSAITAALEGELFADAAEAVTAEPESEQSLEDVFAAFKEHVDREVGSEDFRTHYDLGIAYKEMGLLDESIAEFELAVRSPELGREAYSMLALCHRERDQMEAAAQCYRRAIDSAAGDGESRNNLRYELAEVLLCGGDRQGALDAFRDLLDADPGFRDVRERIAELESRVR